MKSGTNKFGDTYILLLLPVPSFCSVTTPGDPQVTHKVRSGRGGRGSSPRWTNPAAMDEVIKAVPEGQRQ